MGENFPICASCKEPVKHFADWFIQDCPARAELPPVQGGHQLTVEEWMALPFGPREA